MNTHDEKRAPPARQSVTETTLPQNAMSPLEFAQLGDGVVAYVKELDPMDVKTLFPEATDVPVDIALYSLHAADGTPLVLTDSLNAAVANAIEVELELVSLH